MQSGLSRLTIGKNAGKNKEIANNATKDTQHEDSGDEMELN